MCLNPVRLPDGHGFYRYVPCGKCLQCLKSYQDSWCARLNEEIKMWKPVDGYKPVIFFTLDFRNDTIPCRYLVVGKNGLFFQDTKPSCPVFDFWTDTRRESRAKWLARRKDMLSTYWEYVQLMYALRHLELPASVKDIIEGNYIYNMSGFEKIKPMYYLKDLPDFNPIEFFSFSNGGLEHPKGDSDIVFFDYSDVHAPEDYLVAFEFHTCRKDIFQGWFKRSRASLSYNVPDVFGTPCNPRINRYWFDSDKNRLSLPDSALTSSFKYFLTTEYGPKTNRPHAHGVVFGVTAEEFEDYFVKDWQDRYGRVVYSVLNPTGGAMLYVAKYCSKGEYEHPYCKRDYFYNSGEYHSKKYEDVLLDFGFNLPIVLPTFHLVSKGIGACYCYSKEIQNYFGVMLSQLISPTGKLRYTSSSVHYGLPLTPLRDLLNLDNTGQSLSCYLDLSFVGDDLRIRKYSDADQKYLLGEDIIPRDVLIDSAVESFYNNTLIRKSVFDLLGSVKDVGRISGVFNVLFVRYYFF